MSQAIKKKFERAEKHLDRAEHYSNGGQDHMLATREMVKAAKVKLSILEAGHETMTEIKKELTKLTKQGVLVNEVKLMMRNLERELKKSNDRAAKASQAQKGVLDQLAAKPKSWWLIVGGGVAVLMYIAGFLTEKGGITAETFAKFFFG